MGNRLLRDMTRLRALEVPGARQRGACEGLGGITPEDRSVAVSGWGTGQVQSAALRLGLSVPEFLATCSQSCGACVRGRAAVLATQLLCTDCLSFTHSVWLRTRKEAYKGK